MSRLSIALVFLIPNQIHSQEDPVHSKIVIKDLEGKPITLESNVPYSPKKTCGACHDYDQITNGYHFQQGRTDGSGKIVMNDGIQLSSGMYGKRTPASPGLSRLAKKLNQQLSEIDLSSFSFVQSCGACHPGGGWSEYDRTGRLYYDQDANKVGYEGENSLLDGDYTPSSNGNSGYGAPWVESGVSQADCLICHLKGYRWKERGAALKAKFFKDAATVGAGWADFKNSKDESGDLKKNELITDYSKKDIADFENLHLQIVRKPPDENCLFCHAPSDIKRPGRVAWNPEKDLHKAAGLHCIFCHFSKKDHNFAKGNSIQQTVRNDLDNSMHSCEDCHYKGKDKTAPRYKHPFSPRHLKLIACQTCHIPFQTTAADLVYDYASTGQALIYETSTFLSNDPLEPKKSIPGIDSSFWYPALAKWKGRIVPTQPLLVIYWGDYDPETKTVKPISLWKIQELKKPPLQDDNGDGIPELNSLVEIKTFLQALKGKDKSGNRIALYPVLMKGGFLYQLDKKGEVEKIKNEQAEVLDFSISHQVVAGPSVIGARGCKECHSKNSSFFLRKVLVDPCDEKGKPIYVENWERLGIDKEKLGRLLMGQ